jgi:GTP-binding protein
MNSSYQHTRFLTSVYDNRRWPTDDGAEAAFAGRSNAGKSSTINVLCQQRRLAQISKTPGRTRTVNFFCIDEDRRLVDLPGYGYAQAPVAMRRHWQSLVEHYLRGRQSLRGLILVMDIRHPLTAHDWQFLACCTQRKLPVHILLTKADKLSRGAVSAALQKTTSLLTARAIDMSIQAFSTLNHQGLEQAHAVLDTWLDL